ncbi:MAG TPA: TIGR03560 family F420-dependent LLM class oxidoreductase [Chloroflexia bacterium]
MTNSKSEIPNSKFPIRIDIKTAQHERDWDNMLRYWLDAEAEEAFTGAWLFDHFVPINGHVEGPCMDGWTLLAALAAATKRLRLGLMVGCNGYRHPAVLAKIATTIDRVSGGRLDMGLGAGWFELEYGMYGIPFPPPADRIRQLDEACQLMKLLWTQELADFQGRYYNLAAARHEPKPVQQPHPPFTIGGGGEKLTLRVVAKHAHIFNSPGSTPEAVQHKNRVLDEHCAAIGRDPAEIRRSWQFYFKDPAEVEGMRERIEGYLAVGIDHVVIGMPIEYHEGLVGAMAREVEALLRR